MEPGSHLITKYDAAWWRVISSFVHALAHYAPLAMEMLLRVWLYHRTKASHAVGLDGVEAGDGH
jgi:hypothetical protein